ncbi:hypothetical protein MK079_01515 [Candidatus Gracilibacteria bacterium]|nr:hypothetical protein [Candidatus Gracilibacteria bacterium]
MTTITIDEKIPTSQTHFATLKDLYSFLLENENISSLEQLPENQYSGELIDEAQECLKMGKDQFINL